MEAARFIAKVREGGLLELPQEARELGLRAGDEIAVTVSKHRPGSALTVQPNESMLAVLMEIAELNKSRPVSDGSSTQRLLREARSGAMYGYDPIE